MSAKILSDNGSNFVGAEKEIKELVSESVMVRSTV